MQCLISALATPRRRQFAVTRTMLIQVTGGDGRSAAVAMTRPSGSRMPNTVPLARKQRQSSVVWFQPASSDKARPADASASDSSSMSSATSVAPIAHLEFCRLADARLIACDPIGGPGDHMLEIDEWLAE